MRLNHLIEKYNYPIPKLREVRHNGANVHYHPENKRWSLMVDGVQWMTYDETNHQADITGKSKVISTFFKFKNGDYVAVECEKWSKDIGHPNSLKVSLRTNFYNNFLIKEYE